MAESPSQEELAAQIEAELKALKVSDVLVHTIYTVSSLAYRRLEPEDRDLEQVRLAIEALKVLAPVVKGAVPEGLGRELDPLIAKLQLAYADAAKPA